MSKASSEHRPLVVFASCVLVVGFLYVAQAILIPIALAILIAFILSPAVAALERRGLGKAAPSLIVVLSALVLLGGIASLVTSQLHSLVEELPRYRYTIKEKIALLRDAQSPISAEAKDTIADLAGEMQKDASSRPAAAPVSVTIKEDGFSLLSKAPSLFEPVTSAALVLILVGFMLVQRKELRDRLILLLGRRQMTVTTKALDEASLRIRRYLLMQCLVNGTFGTLVGVMLFVLGVDYALLWGLLAALLRFIPYIGPWVGAALPIVLTLASFPGWSKPIAVFAVFLGLELVCNFVAEPLLYGKTAGVSAVALLIAIAFWTWLWGPVGLLMATPLTVCLFVLGKYMPQLKFLVLLMGDEPVGEPQVHFYQRLLAKDEDGAMQIAEDYVKAHPGEEAYDAVIMPALAAIKRDRSRTEVTDEDVHFVSRACLRILEVLESTLPGNSNAPRVRPLVLGCPASDEQDRIALRMLQSLANDSGQCEFKLLGSDLLLSEILATAERERPALFCVGSLPPGGFSHALYLCKRLRVQLPETRIIVGWWGRGVRGEKDEPQVRLLLDAGAERVCLTILEARQAIQELGSLVPPVREVASV